MTEPVYTVQQAYGKPFAELMPPEGWEFTGEFREPGNEYWLCLSSPPAAVGSITTCAHSAPRLILRRVTRKRIIFEEIARRCEVKAGEWASGVLDNSLWINSSPDSYLSNNQYVIYSRREEEF